MKKRFLSLLLAFMLMTSLLPNLAFAEDGVVFDRQPAGAVYTTEDSVEALYAQAHPEGVDSETDEMLYQWQESEDGVVFSDIRGAETPEYQPLGGAAGTAYYRVKATDPTDEGAFAYSDTAAIVIQDALNENPRAEEPADPAESVGSENSSENSAVLEEAASLGAADVLPIGSLAFTGAGTQAEPYQISSAADLQTLAAALADTETAYQTAGVCFEQTGEIDLTGITWTGIGTSASPFMGSYDGKGCAVKNLKGSSGLFGVISGSVSLSNIRLEAPEIAQSEMTGMFLGGIANQYMANTAEGASPGVLTISGCSVNGGSISHTSQLANATGGIIGTVSSMKTEGNSISITECTVADCTVSGGSQVGGIIGSLASFYTGSISSCAVSGGSVSASKQYAGGIAASLNGVSSDSLNVASCYTSTEVSSAGGTGAGGLVGYINSKGTLKDSYAVGPVSGKGTRMGGAVGSMNAADVSMEHVFAAGRVETSVAWGYAGGLTGYANKSKTTNCVALNTEVIAKENYSYAARITANAGTQSGNYAFAQMLLNNAPAADPGESTIQGADAASAQLRSKSFWAGRGFDFSSVWTWNGAEDAGYPSLKNVGGAEQAAVEIPKDDLRIAAEPESAVVYPCDESAEFSVIALGNQLSYQWQSSADGSSNWADVPEAKSAVLTVTLPQKSYLYYRCVISETGTANSVATKAVTLSDLPAEKIATLKGLEFNTAFTGEGKADYFDMSPAFSPETENYTVLFPYMSGSVYFTPVLSDGFSSEDYQWVCAAYHKTTDKETVGASSDFSDRRGSVNVTNFYKMQIRVVEKATGRVVSRYTVELDKAYQMRALELGGSAMWVKPFDSSKKNQEAYLVSGEDIRLMPTTDPKKIGTTPLLVKTGDQSCESGGTLTVPTADLEEGTTLTLLLTSSEENPRGSVDNTYTVTFVKPPADKAPQFLLQEMDSADYTIGQAEEEISPLQVYASASGAVTYQWYKNSIGSTSGGTAIPGATAAEYLPPADKTGANYYYCVASSGGQSKATDSAALIQVYPVLEATLKVLTPGEQLPEVPGVAFSEEVGYYYPVNASSVIPLEMEITTSVDDTEFAASVDYGSRSWSKKTGTGTTGNFLTGSMVLTPSTANPGAFYYIFKTYVKLGNQSVSITSDPIYVHVANSVVVDDWTGKGTAAEPWLIEDEAGLQAMRTNASKLGGYNGLYFKLTDDIALTSWTGGITSFQGILDGDGHTLTFPDGSRALLSTARYATVKNLNIQGGFINDYGLVSNYGVASGVNRVIDIINVTIKSGTTVKNSGFIGGYASGTNAINIVSCKVERGVKIGWDANKNEPTDIESGIGSFGGQFNGTVIDSSSYATVYGKNAVGGLIGQKGQSMGFCKVTNSVFGGEIIATGDYVGGIVGRGYVMSDAPNTPAVSVQNCYVSGKLSGNDYVGGIFGGEPGLIQCWDNGIGRIQNNHFSGSLTAGTGAAHVGAIVGGLRGLNRYNQISNNYFLDTCGAGKGIGKVDYVDTSLKKHETASGAVYFSTANGAKPGISGVTKTDHNREDDPLGADASKLTQAVTAAQLKDGTVTQSLNSGENSYHNWIDGDDYPVLSDEAVAYELTIGGTYKDTYYIGDSLDLTGIEFTAKWSDGSVTNPELKDVAIIGFDSSRRAVITLTASYGAAKAEFAVSILKPSGGSGEESEKIRVSFTLLGDEIHDSEADGKVHTLAKGGLVTWIEKTTYTVDANATAADVFKQALSDEGIVFKGDDNNQYKTLYVSGIRVPGTSTWLSEFTNGPRTGWMYTLDGKHPELGLAQQFLEDGNKIVFHYTDDYTLEQGSEDWGGGAGGASASGDAAKSETSVKLTPEAKAANGKATATTTVNEIKDAIKSAKEEKAGAIVIAPKISGKADSITVELPKAAAESIVNDTSVSLNVETEHGTVAIPNDALKAIASQAAGSMLQITVELKAAGDVKTAVDAGALENAVITEVTIGSGSKEITSFGGKSLTIDLPVGSKSFNEGESYKVIVISADGKTETAAGKCVKTGGKLAVRVSTSHLSTFVVTSEKTMPFTDLEGHWAYEAISYAYDHGIMSGTSSTSFDPNGTLDRAMLASILYSLEGRPAVTAANPFTDVPAGQWYTDAVIWAGNNGIVSGVGKNRFAPTDNITREQLATMLRSYAKYKKYDVSKTTELTAFTDAGKISSWALEPVKWANAAGLISGRTKTTIVPDGTATRAEAATILMHFAENVTKK